MKKNDFKNMPESSQFGNGNSINNFGTDVFHTHFIQFLQLFFIEIHYVIPKMLKTNKANIIFFSFTRVKNKPFMRVLKMNAYSP